MSAPVASDPDHVTGWSHGSYFKRAPSSPAEVTSTLVTLSGVGRTKGVGWDETIWAESIPMERQGPGRPWGWGTRLPMMTGVQAALEKQGAQEKQGMLICCQAWGKKVSGSPLHFLTIL